MVTTYEEFGRRLEGWLYLRASGPKFFTEPSMAIEPPFA